MDLAKQRGLKVKDLGKDKIEISGNQKVVMAITLAVQKKDVKINEEVELDESLLPLFFALYGVGAMVVLPGLIVYDMMLRNKGSNLDDKVSKVVGNLVSKFKKDKNYKPTSAEIDAAKKLEKEAKSKEPNIFKKAMEKLKSIKSKSEEVDIQEDGHLDKVNPAAVKKKFKDRKDKDIDNDGDVDSTDKYLHKRRKAISKAMGEEIIETLDELSPDLLRLMEIDIAKRLAVLKRAQSRTDAAGAAAAKADKRDANVKKGMMPKAGSAADKADIKYRASKARQDRLKRNVATAQDREAEREYQAQKRKRMSQGENYDIGTPENTMAKLDATPGQSQDDWQRQVDTMQKKNASMREALAKIWGMGEGHNPFKTEGGHLPSEKKKKDEDKTMTGKPMTKVNIDPDMKEVKVGKKNVR